MPGTRPALRAAPAYRPTSALDLGVAPLTRHSRIPPGGNRDRGDWMTPWLISYPRQS
jgi:hypothetical protein